MKGFNRLLIISLALVLSTAGIAAAAKFDHPSGDARHGSRQSAPWINAALANISQSYARSLTVNFPPTHNISEVPSKISGCVLTARGTANILIAPFIEHLPETPALIEKFMVFSQKPGSVLWGVNGWQAPDKAYIPRGSARAGTLVETPLSGPDKAGRYYAEFGPFNGSGSVEDFNFRFKHGGAAASKNHTIKIIGPAGSGINGYRENSEKTFLSINFSVDKTSPSDKNGAFRLLQIVEDISGNLAAGSVPILENKAQILVPAYGRSVAKVYFLVCSTSGENARFDMAVNLLTAGEAAEISNGSFTLKPRWIASNAQTQNSGGSSGMKNETAAQKNTGRGALTGSRRYGARPDDIGYLVARLKDDARLLTNLNIDPAYSQDQMLEMFRALEITMNLPSLSLPEGFAIKNYGCESMIRWAEGITPESGTELHGQALKKLIHLSPRLAHIYDVSLFYCDDIAASVYELVNFTYRSISIVNNIAGGLSSVPMVGTAAQKAKFKIQSKMIELLSGGATLMAPHLPPKIGKFLPTFIWAISTVHCGAEHVQTPGHGSGAPAEPGVRTLGKYLAASLSGIGFIDRTQKAVDSAASAAEGLSFEGGFEQCDKMVEDKIAAVDSAYQKAHSISSNDRQTADLAGAVRQLSAYASVIDPAVISKISDIASQSAAGGLYIRSIYAPMKEYLTLDDKMMGAVSLQMNGRDHIPAAVDNKPRQISTKVLNAAKTISAIDSYRKACDLLAKDIASNAQTNMIAIKFESILTQDENLSAGLSNARAQMAAVSKISGDDEIFAAIEGFDRFAFSQISFYGEVISYLAGKSSNAKASVISMRGAADSLSAILSSYNGRTLYKTCSIESVNYPHEIKAGDRTNIKLKVKNVSAGTTYFTLTAHLPKPLSSSEPVKNFMLASNEELEVAFSVKALAPNYKSQDTAVLFTLETDEEEGVIPNSRICYIQINK